MAVLDIGILENSVLDIDYQYQILDIGLHEEGARDQPSPGERNRYRKSIMPARRLKGARAIHHSRQIAKEEEVLTESRKTKECKDLSLRPTPPGLARCPASQGTGLTSAPCGDTSPGRWSSTPTTTT